MTDLQGSNLFIEAWVSSPTTLPDLQGTNLFLEVWATSDRDPEFRGTNQFLEVWATSDRNPEMRPTNAFLEVWATTRRVNLTLPVYPTLDGLSYSVYWKPEFANLPTQRSSNKSEIDLALDDTPIHEFQLTYDFLRNYTSPNEFKRLMGFFLRMRANVGRFLFTNPDDNSVTGEAVDTTDGVADTFGPLQRTFGEGDNVGTEPVGYVNTDETHNVYLDGVLVDSAQYEFDRTFPMAQMLHFFVVPTAGQVITIDYSYYYYVKFSDDNLSFEKFMSTLWTIKQVTLRSCRANT
jgi:hypothetical protein